MLHREVLLHREVFEPSNACTQFGDYRFTMIITRGHKRRYGNNNIFLGCLVVLRVCRGHTFYSPSSQP
jgi:hypothetical protein